MFFPENYVSVSSLYKKFIDKNAHKFNSFFDLFIPRWEKRPLEDQIVLALRWLPADQIESDLLRAIRNDTYIFSPGERITRLDLSTIFDEYQAWSHVEEDCRNSTANELDNFKNFYDLVHTYSLWDHPMELIKSDFLSKKKDNSKLTIPAYILQDGLENLHRSVPSFFERSGFTISFKLNDFMSRSVDWPVHNNFSNISRVLRPFEGWAMCVKKEFAKGLDLAPPSLSADYSGDRPSRPGRPDVLRAEVAEQYIALYPNGHSPLSWFQALRQINTRLRHPASVETLKRAAHQAKVEGKLGQNPTAQPPHNP